MVFEALPHFKYHPKPLATGSIEKSDDSCSSCSQKRGYIYGGPVYSVQTVSGICPWCISDGTAAKKFDATFVDEDNLDDLEARIIDEVTKRTPGFSSWQGDNWMKCCSDACSFLSDEYDPSLPYSDNFWSEVKAYVGFEDDGWQSYLKGIKSKANSLYTFQCLHCNSLHGYSDYT